MDLVESRMKRLAAIKDLLTRWHAADGTMREVLAEAIRLEMERGEFTSSVQAYLRHHGLPMDAAGSTVSTVGTSPFEFATKLGSLTVLAVARGSCEFNDCGECVGASSCECPGERVDVDLGEFDPGQALSKPQCLRLGSRVDALEVSAGCCGRDEALCGDGLRGLVVHGVLQVGLQRGGLACPLC